jgi:hypothetical protein
MSEKVAPHAVIGDIQFYLTMCSGVHQQMPQHVYLRNKPSSPRSHATCMCCYWDSLSSIGVTNKEFLAEYGKSYAGIVELHREDLPKPF